MRRRDVLPFAYHPNVRLVDAGRSDESSLAEAAAKADAAPLDVAVNFFGVLSGAAGMAPERKLSKWRRPCGASTSTLRG